MRPARNCLWIAAVLAGCGSSNNPGSPSDAGPRDGPNSGDDDGNVIVPPGPDGGFDAFVPSDGALPGCAPGTGVTSLYSGASASSLAADDHAGYWAATTNVWAAVTTATSGVPGYTAKAPPSAIVSDGTSVYWIETATSPETTTLMRAAAPALSGPVQLGTRSDPDASGAAQLFASLALEPSDIVIAAQTEVIRVPSGSFSPALVVSAFATSVAADHGAVAFASYFSAGVVPSAGASAVQLTSDVDYSRTKIVMDATNAYWLDSAGITAAPLSGSGTPTVLAPGAVALTVAGGQLYYATYDDQNKSSTILRTATGGAVDVLVTRKAKILEVAKGGNMLYWTEQSGQIVCVERKGL
jgi:hypothetical protein